MRRDFNGEILVALFAVGVLALALVFGIVLTISRNVATPVVSTGTASVTAAPNTAVANGASATPETQPATVTATSTESVTNVDVPTVAPATITPTETINARATLQALASQTSAAVTPTLAVTVSGTVPPTKRSTQTPSSAPSATRTASVRPTSTGTSTPSVTASLTPSRTTTVTPSKTITPQPTYTPIPHLTPFPTFTPQATYTPFPSFTPQPSSTPRPTLTPSRTPTRTLTPSPTLSIPTLKPVTPVPATPIPTGTSGSRSTPNVPCSRPDNWVAYIVQRGDTLFSIARQAGITVAELQRGNCLTGDRIDVGQVLAVPPGSQIGVPTSTGAAPGTGDVLPGINIIQCGDASVQITSPRPGITVSGTISIAGSAIIPNFNFYKLEIRNEADPTWATILSSPTPIQGGLLGQINTAQFVSGIYWVQLTAIDNTSNYPILPCAIRLNFAN